MTMKWGKTMIRLILMTAALAASGAAHAAEPVRFSIDGVALTAPLPSGYCVPTGRDKATADVLASGDQQNITLATLIRCDMAGRDDGSGNDYMLIKTPKASTGVVVSRPDLLKMLGAEFGKAEWQGERSDRARQDAAKGLSEAFDTPMTIEGELKPRGTDADCAYLGGQLQVTGNGADYPIILGGCITSAGNKVVMVYTYDDPGKGGGVAGKMRTARNVAVSIKPAP